MTVRAPPKPFVRKAFAKYRECGIFAHGFDRAVLNTVLRIFLRVIAQSLQANCPGAAHVDKANLHIGAVAFIHRFGSSLNEHVHFHVCVVDGVFEAVEGEGTAQPQVQASWPSVVFHPATGIDAATVAQVQTCAKREAIWCTAVPNSAANPPVTSVVSPPRTHRHRYFGVLAPNSPLRVAVPGKAAPPTPETAAPPKRPAHYQWAVLIAKIYEVFPLLCPVCGGHMRLIAFVTHSADIRQILDHIGVDSQPPHITPACGPPLWEGCDVPVDDGVQGEPDWNLAAQPAPDYEVDQRVTWWLSKAVVDWLRDDCAYATDPNASFIPRSRHCAVSECSNCLGRPCFEAPNPCHAWHHAVLMRLNFLIRWGWCRRAPSLACMSPTGRRCSPIGKRPINHHCLPASRRWNMTSWCLCSTA